MRKEKVLIGCLAVVVMMLTLTADFKGQEPEVEKLAGQVSEDNQKGAIFSYTYFMKFSFEKHKSFPKRKFTRLYEAILPSRFSLNRAYSHPFILLSDSEKNITPLEIINARKEIAKRLEQAEDEVEKPADEKQSQSNDGGYWTMGFNDGSKRIKIDIVQLLRNTRLSNLQRRQIDGRSIVSLDFAPKPAPDLEKSLAYLTKIEGQILIDETDKRIINIEGYAAGTYAAVKDKTEAERQKEAVFLFRQFKVVEGFWFPYIVRLNFGTHPAIFDPIEIEYSYSGYKKASVDVKDQIEASKPPPVTLKPAETQQQVN